ncbi:unnamed protein product, partial [Ascophyllum nodosum]
APPFEGRVRLLPREPGSPAASQDKNAGQHYDGRVSSPPFARGARLARPQDDIQAHALPAEDGAVRPPRPRSLSGPDRPKWVRPPQEKLNCLLANTLWVA